MTTMHTSSTGAGALLREWRGRRRMSQLDLASISDVSTRHLSYVETGRSTPSRELLLHLARHLEVPLREQNDLLMAAGYAPAFSELDLDAPAMRPVVAALETLLAGSEPNPTLVMDRHWNLVMANEAALELTAGVADHLTQPPMNVVDLTLHPDGLAPRISNFDEVAEHIIHRITRQHAITSDPVLAQLAARASSLAPQASAHHQANSTAALAVHMTIGGLERTLLSVVSTFGTALDVTAAELTIETFYDVTEQRNSR